MIKCGPTLRPVWTQPSGICLHTLPAFINSLMNVPGLLREQIWSEMGHFEVGANIVFGNSLNIGLGRFNKALNPEKYWTLSLNKLRLQRELRRCFPVLLPSASCRGIKWIVKPLNNGLIDRANDSGAATTKTKGKKEEKRGKWGRERVMANGCVSPRPGSETTTLRQCTHRANAVIRKQ